MKGWTAVVEALPPEHISVAVLITDEDVAILNWPTCAYRQVDFRGKPGERTTWWAGTPGRYQNLASDGWSVTHWAPLPAIGGKE